MKTRLFAALALLLVPGSIFAEKGDVAFTETFDNQAALDHWSIVDLNGGRTWEYLNGMAAYMLDWQTSLPGDDWLISPSIELPANTAYELRFYMGVLSRTENLKVAFASSDDPAQLQQHFVADYHAVVQSDSGDKLIRFITHEAGAYHIAFYAYSEPDQHRVEVDNIQLVEIGPSSLPASVTNLSAVADDKGSLQATIQFTTPMVALNGESLSSLQEARLYRSGADSPLKTWNQPAVGETLSWIDTDAQQGFNTYRVEVDNTVGTNVPAEVTVYVGNDTPNAVDRVDVDLTAARGVKISWPAVSGSVHGGFIDYTAVTYKVKRGNKTIYEGPAEEYIDESQAESDPQRQVRYSVTPSVNGLTGGTTQSGYIVVGKPLGLPYAESFAGGKMEVEWTADTHCMAYGWNCEKATEDPEYDIQPQDADNGYMCSESRMGERGDQSRLVSPIFNFANAQQPCLTFWFHEGRSPWYDVEYDGKVNDHLQVQYRTLEGEWQDLPDALYYQNASTHGWVECQVMLPRCAGQDMQIGFLATSDAEFVANHDIAIDNISISESPYSHNIVCKYLNAEHKRVGIGETMHLFVGLCNPMEVSESGIILRLYRNGELYEQQTLTLAGMCQQEVVIDYLATYEDSYAEAIEWRAEVDLAGDGVAADNVSPALRTSVRGNDVPVLEGLAATCDLDLNVHLTWLPGTSSDASAQIDPVTVFEDFESYEPFIIEGFGDWTTYDGDQATTMLTPRIPYAYPHQGEPMAFQVFDVEQSGVWMAGNYDPAFAPMDGSVRYLCCPSADFPAENDDWLISPRLDGRQQTICFWASAASYDSEWINVYYSTTDNHVDSFEKLNTEDILFVHEGWHEFKFDLPAGTNFVAVRCIRRSVFLFLDNFTYNQYVGYGSQHELLGYNVYRDGKRLNDTLLDTPYFDEKLPQQGLYTYQVTALYDKGESPYSASLLLDTQSSALSSVQADRNSCTWYNLQGQPVSENRVPGLYIVGGKKVVIEE